MIREPNLEYFGYRRVSVKGVTEGLSWPKIRGKALIAASLLFAAASQTQALAAGRAALVLAAEDYVGLKKSEIGVKRGEAIADALLSFGFDVVVGSNPTNSQARAKLGDFANKAKGADLAVAILIGHGTASGGQTFFLPTNSPIEHSTDLLSRGLSVTNIAQIAGNAGAGMVCFLQTTPDFAVPVIGIDPRPQFEGEIAKTVATVFSSSSKVPVSGIDAASQQAAAAVGNVLRNPHATVRELGMACQNGESGTLIGTLSDLELTAPAVVDPKAALSDEEAKRREALEKQLKEMQIKLDTEKIANEQALKDQAAKDQALRDQAAKDQASKDQALKDQALRDQAAKDQASKDQALKDQAAKDQASKDQALKDQAAKDQAAKDLALKDQEAKAIAAQQVAAKAATSASAVPAVATPNPADAEAAAAKQLEAEKSARADAEKRLREAQTAASEADQRARRAEALAMEETAKTNAVKQQLAAKTKAPDLQPGVAMTSPGNVDPALVAMEEVFDPDHIRHMQIGLRRMTFYSGRIDGIIGPLTREAIKLFQKSQGAADTGYLTPTQLQLLTADMPR